MFAGFKCFDQIWAYPISIVVVLLVFWTVRWARVSRLQLPPGSLGLPLIGETIPLLRSLKTNQGYRQWILTKAARHGPLFKISFLGETVVLMDAPQGNRFLFQNEGLLVEHTWPKVINRLFGPDSMSLKVGNEYRLARRHFFSSFLDHKAVLREMASMEKTVGEHFDRFWIGRSELAALQMARTLTFSIICSFVLSLEYGPELEHLRTLLASWASGIFSMEINLPGFAFYYALKARKAILKVLDRLIAQRRRELAEGRSSQGDVLTAFLTTPSENGTFPSDEEIKDNLLLFLIAGYDTSSVALGMMILEIGRNPHVYDQLAKEHKEILEGKRAKGEGEGLNCEDIAAMKYSWRVFQETLRLHPPVPGAFRIALKDFEYNGYNIPKGWKLLWNNNLSHFDSDIFNDPFTFDPSRWEGKPPIPHTFLPFGGGVRMCPGYEFVKMEMFIFLHHLVSRYHWTLMDPNEPVIRSPLPCTPKGIPIRITPRKLL